MEDLTSAELCKESPLTLYMKDIAIVKEKLNEIKKKIDKFKA